MRTDFLSFVFKIIMRFFVWKPWFFFSNWKYAPFVRYVAESGLFLMFNFANLVDLYRKLFGIWFLLFWCQKKNCFEKNYSLIPRSVFLLNSSSLRIGSTIIMVRSVNWTYHMPNYFFVNSLHQTQNGFHLFFFVSGMCPNLTERSNPVSPYR